MVHGAVRRVCHDRHKPSYPRSDTVERLRKHSLEMEKARLHAMHDEAASLPRVRDKV